MYFRNQHYNQFPFYPQQQINPYYQNQFYYPYGSHYGHQFPYMPPQQVQMPNAVQQYNQKQQNPQQGPSSPLGMFTGADGSFDFQKAVNSFDQVMKTANQMSPIMKQLGSLFTPKK